MTGFHATLFDLTVTNLVRTNEPALGRIVQLTYLRFLAEPSR